MKILLTGVAGYIASVCAEVLVKAGHSVCGLDNFSEGHRGAIPPEVKFWECDLKDLDALDRVFDEAAPEAVMHFAAFALVGDSVKNPSWTYKANVAWGINLLDSMTRHGVKKFVLSSTAATYGEPTSTPIREDHPQRPINPYGRSKLLLENILAEYREWAGLQYVTLRYFNAAGASAERGEDHRYETHLIALLLEVAMGKRAQFQIHGGDYPTPDGSCVRDFIHVLDLADAHKRAIEQLEKLSGEAFNLGTSRGYSVKEVVEAARLITGKPIPAVVGPRRPGDPAVLVASSEKMQKTTGWDPRHSEIESVLQSAWDWRQKRPNGYGD
jgi:UDP-glucose 4-epimerase